MNFLLFILVLIISSIVSNANLSNETQSTSNLFPLNVNVCGGISPLTRWARTSRSDTIQMHIDTSNCRFQTTPMYFTSISGIAGHYLLVGINAIYESSNDGFLINVHSTSNQSADTLMSWSALYQWNVNWFGVSP